MKIKHSQKIALNRYATKLLKTDPKIKQKFKVFDQAKKEFHDSLYSIVKNRATKQDLSVLKKYNIPIASTKSNAHTGLYVVASDYAYLGHERAIYIRLPPNYPPVYYASNNPIPVDTNSDFWKLREASRTAENSANTYLKERHQPYSDLIRSASTFEQLYEVWPEARELKLNTPSEKNEAVIPQSSIDKIKADMKLRKVNS